MYGLLGLLSTSGENFKSAAPLEIYLLRKKVTCSINTYFTRSKSFTIRCSADDQAFPATVESKQEEFF